MVHLFIQSLTFWTPWVSHKMISIDRELNPRTVHGGDQTVAVWQMADRLECNMTNTSTTWSATEAILRGICTLKFPNSKGRKGEREGVHGKLSWSMDCIHFRETWRMLVLIILLGTLNRCSYCLYIYLIRTVSRVFRWGPYYFQRHH